MYLLSLVRQTSSGCSSSSTTFSDRNLGTELSLTTFFWSVDLKLCLLIKRAHHVRVSRSKFCWKVKSSKQTTSKNCVTSAYRLHENQVHWTGMFLATSRYEFELSSQIPLQTLTLYQIEVTTRWQDYKRLWIIMFVKK